MTDKKIESIALLIKNNPLFSSADCDSLKETVKNYCETVDYQKGETIFSPDSYRRAIGVILKGEAQVYKGKMPLSIHKKGNIFGAVTLFGEQEHYATNILALSECKVMFISKEGISFLMKENPDFAVGYIAYLSNRIYYLNSRIDSLTGTSVEDKLLRYIRNYAVCDNDTLALKVKSYGSLAASLDSGRASLYRAMDSLQEKGIINRQEKTIFLLKRGNEL